MTPPAVRRHHHDEDQDATTSKKNSSKAYEMKFASLEVVLAVGDLEAASPTEKFMVGRLQEDVLMGTDPEATVGIVWFDLVVAEGTTKKTTKNSVFASGAIGGDDYFDTLPVGSLVCPISRFIVTEIYDAKEEVEQLAIENEAFMYGDTKLKQQLEDDYISDDDSQFGDEVVMKRARKGMKKETKVKVEDDDDGDIDEVSGDKKNKRKRKTGGGSNTASKKKKVRGLMPRSTMKPVPDSFLQKTGKIAKFEGDVERAAKEVVRAVRSNDIKALKIAAKSTQIANLQYPQSIGLPITPLMWAAVNGNISILKILLEDAKDGKTNPIRRAEIQPCALPTLSTGKQTSRHADYNRRNINASRGGREGNNALLYDASGARYAYGCSLEHQQLPHSPNIKFRPELYDWNLMRDFDEISEDVQDLAEATYSRTYTSYPSIESMVKGGHRNMARRLIERYMNHVHASNSYNFLHLEALGEKPEHPEKPFSKDILAKSVAKMSYTETKFTPLVCACINPEAAYLKALLKAAPEHAQIVDQKESGLVHYAAACKGTGPLEYLLDSHSLSANTVDKRKEIPLHFAARAARPGSVDILLKCVTPDQATTMLNTKNMDGLAATHYAVYTRREQGTDTLARLLKAGADPNMPSTAARNKVSPMHIAARVGDLEKLKLLIEHGGNPVKGDKLGRTPLIHACLNGMAHVAAHLLMIGVNVEAADSSDNRAIHYAAAYGWDDCVQLLLEAGADPDAKNAWKTSPLAVAIQKGRHRVSMLLLDLPTVDVNFKDDEGKALFLRLVEGYISDRLVGTNDSPPFNVTAKEKPVATETKKRKKQKSVNVNNADNEDDAEVEAIKQELPFALQKLLSREDVDLTTADSQGQTVLHMLCQLQYPARGFGQARAIALTKLVLARSRLTIDEFETSNTPSPVFCAAMKSSSLLFKFLIGRGATVSPDKIDSDGRNVCHHLLGSRPHACEDQLDLIEQSVGTEVYRVLLMSLDFEGLTPFHQATLKVMSSEFDKKSYNNAQKLVKSISTRYPEVATVTVGPTKLFHDPTKLAAAVITDDSDQNNERTSRRGRETSHFSENASILKSPERIRPKEIRKALSSRETIVPIDNEHFGKNVMHFVCESKFPHRIKEMLDWLIPLFDSCAVEGGRTSSAMTPLQILLYNTLPGHLSPEASSVDAKTDRRVCLKLLLDCIRLLLEADGGDVNRPLKTLFYPDDDREHYLDGGQKELSQEMDSECIKSIQRQAKAFLESSDPLMGNGLVDEFHEIMLHRERRFWARQYKGRPIHEPLVKHFAAKGSDIIPIEIWKIFVEEFRLDLSAADTVERKSALHISLSLKDLALSRFLCDHCSKLVTLASDTGERPIHVVAKGDDPVVVKLLLQYITAKADEVNQGDNLGRTAFHFSVEKATQRSDEVLEACELIFLQAGARLDKAELRSRRTPLHYCFLEGASSANHFNFPHCLSDTSHDRVDLVSSLLSASGAIESVNMEDSYGRTPLFYAAAHNSTVSSLLLSSKGADLFKTDQDGNTPVNVAILRKHQNYVITILKSLGAASNLPKLDDVIDIRRERIDDELENEARTRVVSRNKHSIVWHAIKQDFRGLVYILLDTSFSLHQAAVDSLSNGSFRLCRKLLLSSDPEVIQGVDAISGRNLLHEVARVKQYKNKEWSTTLAELLMSSGLSVSAQTKDGQTPAHIAASFGHIELVELLVKKDVSIILQVDNDGHFPISRFVRALPSLRLPETKCREMMNLLTSGMTSLADSAFNKVPQTKEALKTIGSGEIEFSLGPNRQTATNNITAKLASAKLHEDIDPSESETEKADPIVGYTTIISDILRSGNYCLVQELLDRGANIDIHDSSGLAPLHHAVLSASVQGVALLLRNRADPNIATRDQRALTPLLVASFQCEGGSRASLEIIRLLLQHGVDIMASCNVSGRTSLHFACMENHFELAELLLRAARHSPVARKDNNGKVNLLEGSQYLIRFGKETSFCVGQRKGDSVQVDYPTTSNVPVSLVSDVFQCGDLSLDSMKALIKLGLKKSKDSTNVAGENECVEEPRSLLHRNNAKDNAEGVEEAGNSEEDEAESNDEISMDYDMTELRKSQARDEEEESKEPLAIQEVQIKLDEFYGSEALLLGNVDFALTKPLYVGAVVIAQIPTEGHYYANRNCLWWEGKVTDAKPNGTYNIDLYRGPLLKGIVRQLIRPWRESRTSWPPDGESENVVSLLDATDSEGRTPLQTVVRPFYFGSYENYRLMHVLINHGASVNETTIGLARPGSDILTKLKLHYKKNVGGSISVCTHKESSALVRSEPDLPPISNETLEGDIREALSTIEADGKGKLENVPPKVNPVCELRGTNLRVLPVSVDDAVKLENQTALCSLHYNVVMTKVEMSHYGYSENKYYKMQIVEDQTKLLFVLVTNWGQVGDYGGQKQETPFVSRESITVEFCKVFKAKTGNKWEDYQKSAFLPLLGKYKPVRLLSEDYEKPMLPNIITMVEDQHAHPTVICKSALPNDLLDTMKTLANPQVISEAATRLGLQQSQLPLGQLSIATVIAAEKKLKEALAALKVVDSLSKPDELKAKREALEQVAILSCQYFELMPTKEGDKALEPLTVRMCNEQKTILLGLKELTTAAQLVISASVKATQVNPLDYVFRALNASMRVLAIETPERIGVEQYFRNTINNEDLIINQVFEVNRNEETSNEKFSNRRLLWHGTQVANMLGVVKEGLQVAPPTAQVSGNAFGNGVYFADMASKSWDYCRATNDFQLPADGKQPMPRAYLLLADVALGDPNLVAESHWTETETEEVDSVWAVGYEGPDARKDVVFAKTGIVVPLGKVLKSPTFQPRVIWKRKGGYRYGGNLDSKFIKRIEAVRTSPDTVFPARVECEYESKTVEIILEHGPLSSTARVLPIQKKKRKKNGASEGRKQRKTDQPSSEPNKENVGDDDDDDDEPTMPEFTIVRKEEEIGNHVQHNEFVVNDTERINLRYIVEITSRAWLEQKLKGKR